VENILQTFRCHERDLSLRTAASSGLVFYLLFVRGERNEVQRACTVRCSYSYLRDFETATVTDVSKLSWCVVGRCLGVDVCVCGCECVYVCVCVSVCECVCMCV